jgi:uncharacterized protein (TIGR00730 family)
MGALADGALALGGDVIGVIPRALATREVAHANLSELVVVETMHERKAAMTDRSDAFAVLPGGFGTLNETFEAITWRQLGLHDKPIGLLDVGGFYAPLVAAMDAMVGEGFVSQADRAIVIVEKDAEKLLDALG